MTDLVISLEQKKYLENNLIKIREFFLRTPSTALLQIFCKLLLQSIVIFKSMTGPDDIGQVDLQA